MSYVKSTLGDNEIIRYRAHFHWTYWLGAFASLIVLGIFLIGIYWFVVMIIRILTTEIVVTSERFVFKRGWIARHTAEVMLSNIEEVNLKQSIVGRLLGFGKVAVRGTGAGLIVLPTIDSPIKLRRAILHAREGVDPQHRRSFNTNGNADDTQVAARPSKRRTPATVRAVR